MPKPPKRKTKKKEPKYIPPTDRPKRMTLLQVIALIFTILMVIVFIIPGIVTALSAGGGQF